MANNSKFSIVRTCRKCGRKVQTLTAAMLNRRWCKCGGLLEAESKAKEAKEA